ncbi:adenylate/guanylate cyclase domain-containing protein [Rhodoferax sp.]|uniref:adenylate/guanylate cyclase domain-containing protein n=1 Tax=Rhodoferax sp. TaxID=50421 RepID=UPI0025DFE991|nr:adenylate/guanylate cyclase domain-containing protein [Rhodoferax sp.]
MGIQSTVVFTDLHGSTAMFGMMGNVRATDLITRITDRISSLAGAHQGQLVKTLGDGVMVVFSDANRAVDFAVDVQRTHLRHTQGLNPRDQLPVRIGIAFGDMEQTAGDFYGDAVNVAARLCDLCGPNQIWASQGSVDRYVYHRGVSLRSLGAISIRGRDLPCEVVQIEWKEEESSDFLTMQAQILVDTFGTSDVLGKQVRLQYLDQSAIFRSFDMPVHIGRVKTAEFVVTDPRVSRTHARLVWRNGGVIVEDLSSYGTWVRFADDLNGDILLRREECVLHGSGDLALGASFSDPSVPSVKFAIA